MSPSLAAPMSLQEASHLLSQSTTESPSLASSKLGHKSHWDEVYERELVNFKTIGDEGDVWFGEGSGVEMVEWLVENFEPQTAGRIVDVGCGNAHILRLLAEAGYAHLTGIDYSKPSIDVARAIAEKDGFGGKIEFITRDVIDDPLPSEQTWDIVLDKGTLDGISLSDETREGKAMWEVYVGRISRMVREGGGVFLITSCNFTKEELMKKWVTPETGLTYYSHIPRPTFQFGGATGSTITSVAFQKL